MRALALTACLAAAPAFADVETVVTDHIMPAIDRFAEGTEALAQVAQVDCTAQAVIPAYHHAFDSWIGAGHLLFGPIEDDGRSIAIAFWPDTRGMVPRTVAGLVADEDMAVESEEEFSEVSIAGRGFYALEHLLFDAEYAGYGAQDYTCALVRAISMDLARMAANIDADWDAYAPLLISAGADGNTQYLSAREASQEVYTALMAGLEFNEEQRIGRPLGTFERPRPTRAEAWRSGRSLRNVVLSLEALRDLARTLAAPAPVPEIEAAFTTALETADALDDPVFAGVSDPSGRLKVEILQQKVGFARDAVSQEIGTALGLAQGFNSADGD